MGEHFETKKKSIESTVTITTQVKPVPITNALMNKLVESDKVENIRFNGNTTFINDIEVNLVKNLPSSAKRFWKQFQGE